MAGKAKGDAKHIYFAEILELSTTKVVEQRVSFHPNQYKRLASIHGEENIICRRMDLNTGEWEDYPPQNTE